MWFLVLYIFVRLFWRAREKLVKQPQRLYMYKNVHHNDNRGGLRLVKSSKSRLFFQQHAQPKAPYYRIIVRRIHQKGPAMGKRGVTSYCGGASTRYSKSTVWIGTVSPSDMSSEVKFLTHITIRAFSWMLSVTTNESSSWYKIMFFSFFRLQICRDLATRHTSYRLANTGPAFWCPTTICVI